MTSAADDERLGAALGESGERPLLVPREHGIDPVRERALEHRPDEQILLDDDDPARGHLLLLLEALPEKAGREDSSRLLEWFE